ncbi:MAG: DUF4886 domain-containing protein [Clostridia bacterium]|nr:DUF4886 domain-containing protein [Clostridia bacterium]
MKRVISIVAFVLLLALLLPSCSAGLQSPVKTEPEKKVTTTKKKEEKETEETPIMQEYDPAEDDIINVLMIGNSFCYYYVEELFGIAKAAGVNMKVCNVYYSGCSLKQHWTWWKTGESNYQYFETAEGGREKVADKTNLNFCLARENWDVISFQRGSKDYPTAQKETTYRHLDGLLNYVKEQFPQSTYYYHHTWAYQVGYDRNGFVMASAEQQAQSAAEKKEIALEICRDFNLIRIPSGDAWQYARQDSRVGDILCNRGKKSDNYHEGEEGGGQYLNACVWFETITGQSCLGNPWRPDTYTLSEPMIAALQEAAHRAVAESRANA